MRIATGIIAGLIVLLFSTFLVPVSAMTASNGNVGTTLVISNIPVGADVFFTMNNGLPIFARAEPDGTVRYLPLIEETLKIDVTQNGNLIDNKTLNIGPAIVTPPSIRSGGGGGSDGGTYPTVTPTPKKNQTNETESIPEETTIGPTVTISEPKVAATVARTETKKTPEESPGFGIILAIGMIATIYTLRRNKIGKR